MEISDKLLAFLLTVPVPETVTSLCVCVYNNAPLRTPTSLRHMETYTLTMILMHSWHFEAPFVLRGGIGGVWGGTGDISCSHNVIHYGRGALERVQQALLCVPQPICLFAPLFPFLTPFLSLSLSVGEMAAAFFPSPRGLRDIPACFPLIRQTYSTYLSLSPPLSLLQPLL